MRPDRSLTSLELRFALLQERCDAFAAFIAQHAFGKALGGEVFGKPERLKQLTDIVWPEIRRLAEAQIAAYRIDHPDATIVLEAAVMLEAGWEDAVDEVWVVVVDPATACARAMERDNVPAEVVQKRIDAQLSNDERRARADIAIENSGDHTALTAELNAWSARS